MNIIVSGIGIVSALGVGVEQNYEALRAQRSGISSITHFRTNHRLPAGELHLTNEEIKQLLHIHENQIYSRTSLLGILAASEALRNAPLPLERIAFVSATSVGGMDLTEQFYRDYIHDPDSGDLNLVSHHDSADSTLAIASHCGLSSFSTTISTACSSSANAIMLAARLIRAGLYDAVLAGGTDPLCQFTLNGFQSLKILDTAPCRPFDNTRAGLNLGEGAAYLLLQRDDIPCPHRYAELIGWANANDAQHQTASSADGEGDYLSMSKALRSAHLTPQDIDYINVHGTGTANNDSSEGAAMHRIFGDKVPPFSSTKAYTGHTLAAAGAIEGIFSILSLQHGAIYPNLHFSQPMKDTNLYPATHFSEGNSINTVMSNSFGFGGNCSTLIFGK